MASRDIASMHLFLEMKKKFPELAEDTIRDYVFQYANDKDKCFELLHKESKNHFQTGQMFAESYLPENNLTQHEVPFLKTPQNMTTVDRGISNMLESDNIASTYPSWFQHVPPANPMSHDTSGRSRSHAGVVWSHKKPVGNKNDLKKPVQSAPVMASHESPFFDSSHSEFYSNSMRDQDNNRMMFSTTKEHIISPPSSSNINLAPYVASSSNTETKRQSVQLSLTPSFPIQQPQCNVYNSTVCATSQLSKPGRHTTSLNLQIQPSSDQYPLEISTAPTNVGQPCNFRDFGSHVLVSVGPQGTTFTSLRLQRPHSHPETQCSKIQLTSSEETACSKYAESSQEQTSQMHDLSVRRKHGSRLQRPLAEISEVQAETETCFPSPGPANKSSPQYSAAYSKDMPECRNTQVGMAHGYQQSQAYMQDVVNHQKARLDLLLQELTKEKHNCEALKTEVNQMEQALSQSSAKKSAFPSVAELQKLREENRKLQIECNCLFIEKDLNNSSKKIIPLGDNEEDFYSNIFTGPNGSITPLKQNVPTKKNSDSFKVRQVSSSYNDEEDDDEQNRWTCKKCTFANHPALEKCEICELSKSSSYLQCNSNHHSNTEFRFVSPSEDMVTVQPRRAVGSIQISVTRHARSPKSVKFQVTHRMPR